MRHLANSLKDHPIALLRAIASLREIPLATNARTEAADQLAALLARPESTAAALVSCSPEAHAAWDALVESSGHLKVPVFARRFGEIRPVGPGKLERDETWRTPASPAEELWYRGLIFRAFANFGDGPAEYVYVPDELMPGDTSTPPVRGATSPIAPAAEPATSHAARNSLAVDLCLLLAAARESPLQLDEDGTLSEALLDRLANASLLPDRLRQAFLVALARRQGWLKPDRGRLAVDLTAATPWLKRTHWQQMTSLFHTWRDLEATSGWNELRVLPTIRAEGNWQNDPILARRTVLEALRPLPGKTWYAVASLVSWVKAQDPDFQRPDGNYAVWYLRDVAAGTYLSGFESWDRVEGALLAFLLAGPLFWLGAIALDGEAHHFRLTEAGLAWMAGRTPRVLPAPARVSVTEDFTVSAPLLCPLLDRFRLLRCTDQVAGPYRLPEPTQHRITRASLARARAAGIKTRNIVDFLKRASGGRLPARVATALERWDEQGGPVRILKGAVVRVDDAAVLARLRGDPAIAPLLGELLSAQAVMVRGDNLPALLAALRDLGYSPKVE